jgi:hypothetical protein
VMAGLNAAPPPCAGMRPGPAAAGAAANGGIDARSPLVPADALLVSPTAPHDLVPQPNGGMGKDPGGVTALPELGGRQLPQDAEERL